MATVPSSGTLSMKSMAQEALYGTYGSGTITNPISLYDMTNGGQVKGSGDDYPEINTDCTPNPETRSSNELPQVREDNHPAPPGSPTTLYYNSSIGDALNVSWGDYLYTNSDLTTALTAGNWYQEGVTGDSEYHCNTGLDFYFDTNSSGRIINALVCS